MSNCPRCLFLLAALTSAPLSALPPMWLQSLTAQDNVQESAGYGSAVAADGGHRVAIGEPWGLSGGVPVVAMGAVEVWQVQGNALVREARLQPPAPLDPVYHFGVDVALSGRWLAVAAGSKPPGEVRDARVHLYRRDGTVWTLVKTLELGSDDAPHLSLISATPSLALQGDWLAVGRPGWTLPGTAHIGEVRMYRLHDGVWQPGPVLNANDAGEDHAFGSVVTLGAGIGGEPLLAVGAPRRNESRGAVYVFRRQGNDWLQEQRLLPPSGGSSGEIFGTSIALRNGTLAIGAPAYSVIQPYAGRVLIWRRRGSAGTPWLAEAQLHAHPEPTENDLFGVAVALNEHGSLMVSAPWRRVGEPPFQYSNAGVVQRYIRAWNAGCSMISWGYADSLGNPSLWLTLSNQFRGRAMAAGPGLLAIGWPGRTIDGTPFAGVAEIRRFDRIMRNGFDFNFGVC